MNNNQSKSDDDDPIVAEYPIFHSTRLEQNLYLLQHSDDITGSFKEGLVRNVSFKPENQEFKFSVPIENSEEEVTIRSQKILSAPERLAACLFNGKEVHLTSVKNVFDLGVDYTNSIKVPNKKKEEKEDESDPSDSEAGPSDMKQITVKFKQLPKSNKKQIISSKSHNDKINSEKWIECELTPRESSASEVERMKLLADYRHETSQSNNLDEKTYFKHLVPEDKEHISDEPSLPSHLISLNALKVLPLLERCREFLKRSQIVQFQQLLMLFAGCPGLTPESLLKTLPQVAVLVRGNWVVKSDILFPPGTLSAIYGVPSENMCRVRDYMLYLFTKSQYVPLKKVASVVNVPAEEIKLIFKGVSSLRHNKGWELNLETDYNFILKYPDIEQRQTLLWEQRNIQVCDFLRDKKRRKSRSDSKSFSEDNKKTSDNDSGTELAKSPTKSPPRKKKRVVSLQLI